MAWSGLFFLVFVLFHAYGSMPDSVQVITISMLSRSRGDMAETIEFTELGAGFKVAMRDLEIRGAGNIVGREQHGHMIKIGYELYCKLVDDAVKRLDKTGDRNTCLDAAKKRADTYESSSKKKNIPLDDDEVSLEFDVAAYIPEKYISDERLKLHMYKKIASIENEYDEMEITDELIDRFGDIPRETLVLIKIARIKTLARKNNFNRLAVKRDKIRFYLDWSERGVEGAHRFLGRVWRYVEEHLDVLRTAGSTVPMNRLQDPVLRDFKRRIHTTIEAVTRDIDKEKQFNTAIARLMELTNALYSFSAEGTEADALRREAVSALLGCLSPFSPHISEEL